MPGKNWSMYCRAALLLLMSILVLASCAPLHRKLTGAEVSPSFADGLVQEWHKHSSGVSSVRGLAKIKVQAPWNSLQNGTQVLLAEKPDRLRAETLSPFGSPLLLLAADGERLSVSVPSQNLYYTGVASPENIGLFINLPLSPADLVAVLLYQPALIDAWKEEAFVLQEGGWLLVRHGTLRRQELTFNPMRQLVEVSFFEQLELVLQVNYAQFSIEEDPFPRMMRLEVPAKRTTVSLEFSDLETNAPLRAGLFKLTPPPGAQVVYLSAE